MHAVGPYATACAAQVVGQQRESEEIERHKHNCLAKVCTCKLLQQELCADFRSPRPRRLYKLTNLPVSAAGVIMTH